MVWTRQNVQQWVDWTIAEYTLTGVNPVAFAKMDGKALCSLTKEDFYRLTNSRNADTFLSHLNYLRSRRFDLLLLFIIFVYTEKSKLVCLK